MAKQTDTITWLQVHNFLPIAGLIIGGIMGYSTITTSNALQDERISRLSQEVSTCKEQATSTQQQVKVLGAKLTPTPIPLPTTRVTKPNVMPSTSPTPRI